MGYTNSQRAEILGVFVPNIKRLASCETKFPELYERLEELKIMQRKSPIKLNACTS